LRIEDHAKIKVSSVSYQPSQTILGSSPEMGSIYNKITKARKFGEM
jgi:hypothetical protein